MKPIVRAVTTVALLALSPLTLKGQDTGDSDWTSFFRALAPEISAQDVFAIDAGSFSEMLRDSLGWEITPEDVEGLLGQEFQYGRLHRFLACEAPSGCYIAKGAHLSLGSISATEGSGQVTLRLDLTGAKEDPALVRRIEFLTLQRSNDEWQVRARRVVG